MNVTNKPMTMAIKETKSNIINIINSSGLPPAILDLIVQCIYAEVHNIAEKQADNEEKSYMKTLKHDDMCDNKLEAGGADES